MIFYLKEEFLSFDHFDIWDENDRLVYSADREFFNFGKKLIVQDASGRQVAAVQHRPFSLPCTYALSVGGRDYDLTRNFAFFSRSYSLDELGWEIEGDFMSLDYEITKNGSRIAAISHAFLTLGDRYALEGCQPAGRAARPLHRSRHRLLRRGAQPVTANTRCRQCHQREKQMQLVGAGLRSARQDEPNHQKFSANS